MAHSTFEEPQIDFRPGRFQPRVICKQTPVILLGRDDGYLDAAPGCCPQPLIKWKSYVGTLDKDRSLRSINQIDHALKSSAIVSSVSVKNFQTVDFSNCLRFLAFPRVDKISAQERDGVPFSQAKHHVMPGSIVLAKVYAAKVSSILVDEDQFLVIAA